jgi:hypothetical protein
MPGALEMKQEVGCREAHPASTLSINIRGLLNRCSLAENARGDFWVRGT